MKMTHKHMAGMTSKTSRSTSKLKKHTPVVKKIGDLGGDTDVMTATPKYKKIDKKVKNGSKKRKPSEKTVVKPGAASSKVLPKNPENKFVWKPFGR
jgi:hypothetical protein